MKRFGIKLSGFMMLAGSVALSSCSDSNDVIYDYSPFYIMVEVLNNDGENLLNASTPSNILDSEMFLSIDDQTNPVTKENPWDPDNLYNEIDTRYYLPDWRGAFIADRFYYYQESEGNNYIFIGELEAGWSYENSMELSIAGKTFNISYKNKSKKGVSSQEFYLDGKKQKNAHIVIRL